LLLRAFVVEAFKIPSPSMFPTLEVGDHIFVNKFIYGLRVPLATYLRIPMEKSKFLTWGRVDRGEVVVFVYPKDESKDFIKRVVAVGGETIEIRQNQVFIDGASIDEPYLNEGTRMGAFGPVTVPEGHLFVMGDNRNQSQDSRRFGTISESEVIGRAFVTVWPPSRWTGL
ncbi:signal peptidase I, partial [bacterium]|nr:signal peptidase I [bacterium]